MNSRQSTDRSLWSTLPALIVQLSDNFAGTSAKQKVMKSLNQFAIDRSSSVIALFLFFVPC